jgi:hypothetical protein
MASDEKIQPNTDTDKETLIEQEQLTRYQKPWSKLDKGVKLNRILLFIKQEKTDKSLTNNQEKHLKYLLIHLFENNGLNKSSDIEYNQESMKIESIKLLNYNEQVSKYSIQKINYKSKTTSKSKSNIEKHLSRTN